MNVLEKRDNGTHEKKNRNTNSKSVTQDVWLSKNAMAETATTTTTITQHNNTQQIEFNQTCPLHHLRFIRSHRHAIDAVWGIFFCSSIFVVVVATIV